MPIVSSAIRPVRIAISASSGGTLRCAAARSCCSSARRSTATSRESQMPVALPIVSGSYSTPLAPCACSTAGGLLPERRLRVLHVERGLAPDRQRRRR